MLMQKLQALERLKESEDNPMCRTNGASSSSTRTGQRRATRDVGASYMALATSLPHTHTHWRRSWSAWCPAGGGSTREYD